MNTFPCSVCYADDNECKLLLAAIAYVRLRLLCASDIVVDQVKKEISFTVPVDQAFNAGMLLGTAICAKHVADHYVLKTVE